MDNNNNNENILLNILGNFKNSTKLEEKLIDLNYPLEEFLKDDEAIECYKNMGENTKRYFQPQIVKQLIKYVTVEPENDDYLKGHKYPYMACQILKIDCPYIQDLFVLNEKEYNIKYNNKDNNETKEKDNNLNQQKTNIENIIDISEKVNNNNEEKHLEKENNKNIINENEKELFLNFEEKQNLKNEIKEINNNKELKENNDNNIKNIIKENNFFKKELEDNKENEEEKNII